MAKREPAERKKEVFNILVEKGGSMRSAMIQAGYSEKYAKNPKKFRTSASWIELLEENLPDWLLTETHMELLGSSDQNVRLRAVDLGYKIKGKNVPEVTEHIIRNYEDLTDEELSKLYHAKLNRDTKKTND